MTTGKTVPISADVALAEYGNSDYVILQIRSIRGIGITESYLVNIKSLLLALKEVTHED